ncbi:Heh2p PWA37_000598 [Arxiozyma heterogenica]|uniref:Inner nuclear membrane protein SRC1 n=1 Tax=Arxiozyma heterogenica TaxID=278026 RepID=A0AAN7WK27_9SACH|nr:hypothetical protein RI543_000021 [Kazachstania heterogenica]
MDPSFLEPGFDPKNLTVAQLRGILIDNNVHLPSKVKKSRLIGLFNSEIVPKLDELRDKYKDVKPSSKGIKKVTKAKKTKKHFLEEQNLKDSTSTESSDNNNDNNKNKRKREHLEDEKDDNHIIEADIKHTVLTDKDKIKDNNEAKTNSGKRKKKKLKTEQNESTQIQSSIIPETIVEAIQQNDDDNFPFIESSNEMDKNISEIKTVEKQTTSPNLSKLKVSPEFAILLRNATEDKNLINEVKIESTPNSSTPLYQDDTTYNSLKNNEKTPIPEKINQIYEVVDVQNKDSTKASSREDIDIITDSEDASITIDTDTKIEKRDQKNERELSISTSESVNENGGQKYTLLDKNNTKCTSPRKLDFQKIKHSLFNIIMFIFITSAVLFILWYREQRIRIGYCGAELPPQPIVPAALQKYIAARFNIDLNVIDDWLYTFNPKCLPCPDEAICFPKLKLTCKSQYRKIVPLLSLYNLVPLSPYCIPDVRKIQFLDSMFNKFVNLLRRRNASFNCGKGINQKRNSIPYSHLHDIFGQNVDQAWTQDEVEELWNSLSKKLDGIPEIEFFNIESNDSETIDVYIRSISQEYSSLWCKYGNQITEFLKTYKLILVGFILILSVVILINSERRKRMAYKKKIEQYVNVTIEKLRTQTGNHKDGDFLHMLQIRDIVLVDVVDLNERKKIWKDMVKVLRDNEEIVTVFAEINGEILECWSYKEKEEN